MFSCACAILCDVAPVPFFFFTHPSFQPLKGTKNKALISAIGPAFAVLPRNGVTSMGGRAGGQLIQTDRQQQERGGGMRAQARRRRARGLKEDTTGWAGCR
jgi:hypothetical protein